jgi:cytochrome P450
VAQGVTVGPATAAGGGAAFSADRVLPHPPAAPLSLPALVRTVRDNAIGAFSRDVFATDIGEARFLFQRFVILNHPDYIKHVLVDRAENYPKGRITRQVLRPSLGDGLLTLEGAAWRRHRRIMAPAFHHDRVTALAGVMTDAARALAVRWRDIAARGGTTDVLDDMATVTMEIVARSLFTADISRDIEALGAAMATLIGDFARVSPIDLLGLPEWLPRRRARAAREALAFIDRTLLGLIAARRAAAAPGTDLLGLLLAARDAETGQGLTDRELRDEVMTLFAAGHETTAVALTWTWYALGQAPAVDTRLADELARVLGGRTPDAADLDLVPYARMVIEETMRLFPPAFSVNRVARAADAIGGLPIRPGTLITISPYVTHRNPKLWPDPLAFDPERFRPDAVAARPRFAYFPFGGGPSICIGSAFALMEARLVLATLAQEFRLRALPGRPVEALGRGTLRPRGGMPMTVALRARPAGRAA